MPASCTSDGSSTTTRSGIGDRVVPADRPVGDARERAQRRAAALRAVLRERLHALAVPQQRQRQDLGGRLGALSRARVPADLGQAVHRSASSSARTARFASATAWTTLAPPLTASPAAKILAAVVRPCSSTASSRVANSSRGRWPIAFTTMSTGTTNSLPGTAPAPAAALVGRPQTHLRAADSSTRPSPTNATGLVRKRISTLPARELDLVLVRRHLVLRAPVEEERDVGAEPLRLDRDVDGGVAAADDGDTAADRWRLAGLQPLDERQRLPDAVEIVALVGDVDVGAQPDGEHDRVDLGLQLRSRAGSTRSPSRNSTPSSAESRASSGSGSLDWRYGAIP